MANIGMDRQLSLDSTVQADASITAQLRSYASTDVAHFLQQHGPAHAGAPRARLAVGSAIILTDNPGKAEDPEG